MTLLEIRTLFAKHSGFMKYVKGPGYADNGANFFIEHGQLLLDYLRPTPGGTRSYLYETAAGEFQKALPNCRVVDTVYRLDSEGRVELIKQTTAEMRERFEDPAASTDNDAPAYWSHLSFLDGSLQGQTSGDYANVYYDVLFGKTYGSPGILTMPPADGVYTMEVHGRWFSKKMSGDSDESWWSVTHPAVLVQAAILAVEIFFRNREGFAAGLDVLEKVYLRGIAHDEAVQESVHSNRIKG